MLRSRYMARITLILVVIFLNSCSHKNTGYICVCDPRVPQAPGKGLDTFYRYRNLSWSDAYAKCILHIDSLDTCVLGTESY